MFETTFYIGERKVHCEMDFERDCEDRIEVSGLECHSFNWLDRDGVSNENWWELEVWLEQYLNEPENADTLQGLYQDFCNEPRGL